jgi:Protein of unknown function (DUF2868)
MSPPAACLDEKSMRQVLLVQAFDASPADNPLWTPEDRVWATRLARESTPKGARPERFVNERAQHAQQRLLPRDPGAARLLHRRLWRGAWLLLAAVMGLACGLLADLVGSSQRINLLAPPVWGVVLWNVLVYLGLVAAGLLPARWPKGLGVRLGLAQRLSGRASGNAVMTAFQAAWLRVSAPLMSSRAATLLHIAAAALALGLIASLYVRGLVLDYRATWQSTFLDAPQVHATLALLFAPVAALTGLSLPDLATVQALRGGPDAAPPSASAAPWIHLYAALLAMVVVVPRSVLAAWAAWRAKRLAKRLPLPLQEAYFARLQRDFQGGAAHVQVLPHGAAPSAQAVAGLRRVLASALGDAVDLTAASAVAYGDEEQAAPSAPDTTLRLLLVDLASTPEADTHGRFVHAQRAAAPGVQLLLLTDESAWRARFAGVPSRLAERRLAWQGFAAGQGLGWFSVDLSQPDVVAADAALQRALQV